MPRHLAARIPASSAYRPSVPAGGATRRANQRRGEETKYQGAHTRKGKRPAPEEYTPSDPYDEPSERPVAGRLPRGATMGQPGAGRAYSGRQSSPRDRFEPERYALRTTDIARAYPRGTAVTPESAAQYERHRARDAGRREFMDITDREMRARARGQAAAGVHAAATRARAYGEGQRQRVKAQYAEHEPAGRPVPIPYPAGVAIPRRAVAGARRPVAALPGVGTDREAKRARDASTRKGTSGRDLSPQAKLPPFVGGTKAAPHHPRGSEFKLNPPPPPRRRKRNPPV